MLHSILVKLPDHRSTTTQINMTPYTITLYWHRANECCSSPLFIQI